MATQEIENLYNTLPLIFFICFILQFIGIIRHYKINIYSLGYLIYFPIWLFVLFAILGAICALCFKKDDYLMIMLVIVFPILSIVYISVALLKLLFDKKYFI